MASQNDPGTSNGGLTGPNHAGLTEPSVAVPASSAPPMTFAAELKQFAELERQLLIRASAKGGRISA